MIEKKESERKRRKKKGGRKLPRSRIAHIFPIGTLSKIYPVVNGFLGTGPSKKSGPPQKACPAVYLRMGQVFVRTAHWSSSTEDRGNGLNQAVRGGVLK